MEAFGNNNTPNNFSHNLKTLYFSIHTYTHIVRNLTMFFLNNMITWQKATNDYIFCITTGNTQQHLIFIIPCRDIAVGVAQDLIFREAVDVEYETYCFPNILVSLSVFVSVPFIWSSILSCSGFALKFDAENTA